MFEVKRPVKEGGVRVTTAYNRMLGLPGAWVRDVALDQVLSAAEFGHGGVALGGHRWGRYERSSNSGRVWGADG